MDNTKTKDLEDDEIAKLLKTVAEHFDKEDRSVRDRQIRRSRRLKFYWNNLSQIYWNESAQDYRIAGRDGVDSNDDTNQDYYDKPVNVFKAFLETIIAALSIQIPAINCVPDDADNPLDVSTAKAGDEIAKLVYKHNDAILLWLHALYVYCTEDLIACYNYVDTDEKYGTVEKPKFKDEEIDGYQCPQCGARVPDMLMEQDDSYDAEESEEPKLEAQCIECNAPLAGLQQTKLKVRRLVGITNEPKSRICLEVYGGLYVKVANYAKTQADTPYLIFSHETHYANALECYPDLKDKLPQGGWNGPDAPYEQYGRLNTQYRNEYPVETVTVKISWLRPAAFNILDEDDMKKLKKKFPNGVKFVMVNNVPAEMTPECLDDHWTLAQDPMSDYLNHDPLGELLTNIQDIINDLISLTLQTIEHGIAQTWVDPAVVNLNAQRQIEAAPGTLTATKPVPGSKNISEAFYTSQTASLSPEIFSFYQIIQELGQFVSGALPSLFGGQPGAGTSRTASEYAMSKGMAMQRLQTPFRMITIWWKRIFSKVIPMYMDSMIDDERMVQKNSSGGFINVFLRKAAMGGKIGSIELEPSDKLPITDEQQADMIMQLLNLNNAEIQTAIMDPKNLPYLAKVTRIPSFNMPGEDNREKQNEEIVELLNSTPLPPDQNAVAMFQQAQQAGDQTAQPPQEQPSVPIDPDIDDHNLQANVCKEWAVSEAGRLAKKENEAGYTNVLLHMKAHLAIIQDQAKQQQLHDDQLALAGVTKKSNSDSGQPKGNIPTMKAKQSDKVNGASDARTPVQ